MKKKIVAVALIVGLSFTLGCTTTPPKSVAGNETALAAPQVAAQHDRDGFVTRMDQRGHLWVFYSDSKALADYDSKGAPAVHNVRPLAGPERITMKEVDEGTINAYLQAKPGFVTRMDRRGHLWVFYTSSNALADYDSKGAPAVHNVRPLAGPERITMKEVDEGTIDAYLQAKPGFATRMDRRGHLWVFYTGSNALADYDSKGAPAVHNVRPLAGPERITMKEVDEGTIDAFLKANGYGL